MLFLAVLIWRHADADAIDAADAAAY